MKKGICRIVGAADFSPKLLPPAQDGDYLIAADGGFESLKKAGITPDFVIGDYDSLGYRPELENQVTLPTVKDDTDMIAAAKLGLEKGYVNFEFYGVLGGKRFSHSLAAVQTLCWLRDMGARGELIDPNFRVMLLEDETKVFSKNSVFISVFAVNDAVVTLKGLKYELYEYPLSPRFPLGVSNEFLDKKAEITVHGTVVIVIEKK